MDDKPIKAVLQDYFDGCYDASFEKLDRAFHKGAHIYGVGEDGTLADTERDVFVARVGAPRPEGFQRDYPRADEVLSIDFTGENTAVARVKLRVGKTLFTDILCVICLEGKWGIIAKVLSGEPIAE